MKNIFALVPDVVYKNAREPAYGSGEANRSVRSPHGRREVKPAPAVPPSPLDDELPGTVAQVPMHDPLIYSLQVGPHGLHPEREQQGDLRRQRSTHIHSQNSLVSGLNEVRAFLKHLLKSDPISMFFETK